MKNFMTGFWGGLAGAVLLSLAGRFGISLPRLG